MAVGQRSNYQRELQHISFKAKAIRERANTALAGRLAIADTDKVAEAIFKFDERLSSNLTIVPGTLPWFVAFHKGAAHLLIQSQNVNETLVHRQAQFDEAITDVLEELLNLSESLEELSSRI